MTGLPGLILAGGRATRMGGGDKWALQLGGQSLMGRVIARLTPQCSALAINTNGDAGRMSPFGQPVIADTLPGFPGPLAGVLAGLDWAAAQGASALVTVAADTPFFPADLVARLCEAGDFALAASPDQTGVLRSHPTFGLWPVALRDALHAALTSGQRGVGRWAQSQGAVQVAFVSQPFDPFFNINTPGDLALAEALLGDLRTE